MAFRGAPPTAKGRPAVRPLAAEQVDDARPRPPSKPPPRKPPAKQAAAPQPPAMRSATPKAAASPAPPSAKRAAAAPRPPGAAAAPAPKPGSGPAARPAPPRTAPPQAKGRPPALEKATAKALSAPPRQRLPAIVVFSTDPNDDLGIHALICGEYSLEGSNHGRKTFKKILDSPSSEDVRLYYWDERDGLEYSGWYFGDEVGGQQVWLHSQESGLKPPRSGWTYREGDVREELLVLTPEEKAQFDSEQQDAGLYQQEDYQAPEDSFQEGGIPALEALEEEYNGQEQAEQEFVGADGGEQYYEGDPALELDAEQYPEQEQEIEPQYDPALAAWEAKVQRATSHVEAAESDAAQALEMAHLAMDSDLGLNDDSAMRAQELLAAQAQPLQEVQRALAAEGLAKPDAPPTVRTAAVELTQRVRALLTNVKAEEKRLATARAERQRKEHEELRQAQEAARVRELEAKHASQLQELLAAVSEKVSLVEDEIEKVEIAATPLEVEASNGLRAVMMQAVQETEQQAKVAGAALAEGRRVAAAKVAQAKRMVQGMKCAALDEILAQQEKLNVLQAKLLPYGSMRQTFEQRIQARKILDELSEKITTAELEVERAVIACSPVSADTDDVIKEGEQALAKARNTASKVARDIEAKLQAVPKSNKPLTEGLEEMQSRTSQVNARLQDCQQAFKDLKERAAADILMREVSDKTNAVELELQKMADAENLLAEDDSMSPDEQSIVAEVEQTANSAHSVLTASEVFVKQMLADPGKAGKDSEEMVSEAVQQLKTRLEEGKEALKVFTTRAASLKRRQLVKTAEKAVAEAEEQTRSLADIARALGDAGPDEEEALKEGMLRAVEAERTVQSSIISARKCILDTSSELRKLGGPGSGPPPELAQLQARVSAAQQEAVKLKAAAKSAEDRAKVRGQLMELIEKVRAVESEALEVAGVAEGLAGEEGELAAETAAQVKTQAPVVKVKLVRLKETISGRLKVARGALREELLALEGRLRAGEEQVGDALAAIEAQKEGQQARDLAAQASEHVEQAEAEVRKVTEAELPFLTGAENLAGEAAQEAITGIEAAMASATSAIAKAKTLVAKAHSDTAKLSGQVRKSVGADFSALSGRLTDAAAKLAETQQDMAGRRRGLAQQFAVAKVSHAEAAMQQLAAALDKLAEDKLDSITPDEAHEFFEELATAEKEASDALSGAKDLLTEQQKQVRNAGEARAMAADITKAQSKLRQLQVEFARLSRESQTREQRFVAHQMLKEAPENLDRLEGLVEASHTTAAALLSGNKAELLQDVRQQAVLGFLRAHSQVTGMTVEKLVQEITNGETVTVADVSAFLDKLPCVAGADSEGPTGVPGLSGEQAAGALLEAAGTADTGVLSAEGLQQLFRERLVCKARAAGTEDFEGNTEATTVESGEIVEVVTKQQDAEGLSRAECILARDGRRVWLNIQSSSGEGEADFGPCTSNAGRVESILAFVEGVSARCAEEVKDAEQKAEMCASQGGQQKGPLAEVRTTLLQLKMKASVLAMKMEQLRKRVLSTKTALLQKWESVQAQASLIQSKVMLEKLLKEAVAAVEAAETKAMKVVDSVKAGKIFKLEKEKGSTALDDVKRSADEATKNVVDAKAITAKALAAHEANKGLNKSVLDARVQLMKLTSRVTSVERKCRMATEVLSSVLSQAQSKRVDQARKDIRAAIRRKGQDCDSLFEEYAMDSAELADDQLLTLLKELPGLEVQPEDGLSVLRSKTPADRGVRRCELAEVVQDFVVVCRPIAITSTLKIIKASEAQKIRQLDDGELLEVFEGPIQDPDEAATAGPRPFRVHARALRDGATGWVTTTGNRGTTFLQSIRKPFMVCSTEKVELYESDGDPSPAVATVQEGDMLELLEGPRETAVAPELLLNGSATSDGQQGWIALRDLAGETSATLSDRLHVCRMAIAMTDIFDIQTCKIIRKITSGELLEAIPSDEDQEVASQQDHEDDRSGVKRRRFRALSDGATGWVTVMGSGGTVYLQASSVHYVLSKRIPLCRERDATQPGGADAGVDSAQVVRWLEVGEAFEAVGSPEEGPEQAPHVSVRVRATNGSLVSGWASWSKGGAKAKAPLQLQAPPLPA